MIVLVFTAVLFAAPEEADRDRIDFFEKRVRPVLAESCFGCHGPAKQKAHLRLDHISTILGGGDRGPEIIPGHPEKSRLVDAIGYANVDLQMPPKKKLPAEVIADLTTWVKMGAPWPAGEPPPAAASATAGDAGGARGKDIFDLDARRRSHWAWRPIRSTPPPHVKDASWPRSAPDRFLLARLEEKGLTPARGAEQRTLIRRLHHDLLGLPPAPDDVEAFDRDDAPDALERLTDRLLASPRFGERWARHWLDLVRYAETLGHEFDYPIHNAWRYRDYVIRAWNADLPYHRFVLEHVAGDLLEEPRSHPVEGFNESVIGTACFWLGQQTHSPVDLLVHRAEVIDNQIDVLSKAFLGLTAACARCHDHKFDAISTRDYYALFGIFSSSRYRQAAIDPPAAIQGKASRLAELKSGIQGLLDVAQVDETGPASATGPAPAALFADFRDGSHEGWFADGPAFTLLEPGLRRFLVRREPEGRLRIEVLRGGWVHSALLSRRLQGALRSPTFPIEKRFVHVWAMGRSSRINVVIDGYTLIREPIYGGLKRDLGRDEPRWETIDAGMWLGHRAYIELSDLGPADPADTSKPGGYGADGYIAVERVVLSDDAAPPGARGGVPEVLADLPAGAGAPPERLRELLAEYARVEDSIPEPTLVPAMADGTGEDARVHVRGSPKSPGEAVPRRFLEAIAGASQAPLDGGSGRLGLARRMLDPSNPFLARVMVNRVWHHLFGRGIVASTDDFGFQGQPPSHPELLDWLAAELPANDWSLKRLIRSLILSRAYRMSSAVTDATAEAADPVNVLLHRMPLRRMEGEALRDKILAVSGRLEPRAFGPPVPIHLTPFMDGRGRPERSGPVDGAGRRSVYLEVRRNFLDPFLLAFDTPVPATTAGRRSISNVPAQALILLNDPFVAGQAREWARLLLSRRGLEPPQRIAAMYRTAYGRPSAAGEVHDAIAFLEEQGAEYGLPAGRRLEDDRVWADLAHVLINGKEFAFVP